MLVLKFGGTSVGSIENMINVKNIINNGNQKVVVFSIRDMEDELRSVAMLCVGLAADRTQRLPC